MKDQEKYIKFLERNRFNDDQINLIIKVRNEFLQSKGIDIDNWERDQWYTFNRSGLFESDQDENKSGITNWTQSNTRYYITEY